MMQDRLWYSLVGKTAKPPSRPWSTRATRGHAPWLAADLRQSEGEVAAETGVRQNGASARSVDAPENGVFRAFSGAEKRSQFRRLAGYVEPSTEIDKGVSAMKESVKAIARPAASRSLREAIRKARVAEAERLDFAADHRDGEIARLELLKAELEGVFAEIPRQDDRFNLTLVPSRPARLWVDLFTYAAVDDATGAYLFIRNSENGRRTLYSASNVADMADRITSYIAREIVRRERMEAALADQGARRKQIIGENPIGSQSTMTVLAFVIGVLTGAAGLFAMVWLSAT